MKRAPAILLVLLAGCSSGLAVALSIDVECPSPLAQVDLEMVLQPSGRSITRTLAPSARRVVVLPPAGTRSIAVTLTAFDASGGTIATNQTDVVLTAANGFPEVVLPLSCPGCTATCGDDQLCCGPSCVDPDDDPDNCGGCEAACSTQHATPACVAGNCTGTCDALWGDCDHDLRTDGCEHDLSSDAANCGACGQTCDTVCTAGTCARRVFVSSMLYGGDLGGLDGADAQCDMLAQAAGLPGTYRAWLGSVSVTAQSRFSGNLDWAYEDVAGNLIADDLAELIAQGPKQALSLDEHGATAPDTMLSTICGGSQNISTWTGMGDDGTNDTTGDCQGWTSAATTDSSAVGLEGVYPDPDWGGGACTVPCSYTASLLCFQQ